MFSNRASGLVVKFNVAIVEPRVRFSAGAFFRSPQSVKCPFGLRLCFLKVLKRIALGLGSSWVGHSSCHGCIDVVVVSGCSPLPSPFLQHDQRVGEHNKISDLPGFRHFAIRPIRGRQPLQTCPIAPIAHVQSNIALSSS